jgi:hypothetical protein
MAMDAVVLLRVTGKTAAAAVADHLASPAGAKSPKGLVSTSVDGGSLLYTRLPFSAEPGEILSAVKKTLGKALDEHKDKRGVYVFPELGRGSLGSYDEIIEELGELGYWAHWSDVGKKVDKNAIAANPSFPGVDPSLMQNLASAAMSNDPDEMARLGAQFGDLLAKQAGLGDLADMIRKAAAGMNAQAAIEDEFEDDDEAPKKG